MSIAVVWVPSTLPLPLASRTLSPLPGTWAFMRSASWFRVASSITRLVHACGTANRYSSAVTSRNPAGVGAGGAASMRSDERNRMYPKATTTSTAATPMATNPDRRRYQGFVRVPTGRPMVLGSHPAGCERARQLGAMLGGRDAGGGSPQLGPMLGGVIGASQLGAPVAVGCGVDVGVAVGAGAGVIAGDGATAAGSVISDQGETTSWVEGGHSAVAHVLGPLLAVPVAQLVASVGISVPAGRGRVRQPGLPLVIHWVPPHRVPARRRGGFTTSSDPDLSRNLGAG